MFIATSFTYKMYLFYTVVWLIYNVVLVSGVEWSDSVIYELNFFQILSPYVIKITFQQNTETAIKSWFVVMGPVWGLFFFFKQEQIINRDVKIQTVNVLKHLFLCVFF